MLLEEEKKWLFSGDQISAHNIWHFQGNDVQAPFQSTLHSLKELALKVTEDYKIYPAHDIIPIQKNYLTDLIDCFEWELQENYKKDAPFHSFAGDGYQHFYQTVNLIYSDERLGEFLERKIER